MQVPISIQFDPDLPLFSIYVKGHLMEIYFTGHKSNMTWTLYYDSEEYSHTDLHNVILKAEEIAKYRYNVKKIKIYFPVVD